MVTDGGGDAPGDGADAPTPGRSRRAIAAAVIAAVGVVGSGLADYLLSALGGELLGGAVWAVGYLTTVAALWYVLLRPIDFGDGSASEPDPDREPGSESDP